MGERSLAHSAGASEETVRVAAAIVNAAAASTMHQERERIGRRRRVVGMVLLWNLPEFRGLYALSPARRGVTEFFQLFPQGQPVAFVPLALGGLFFSQRSF